MNETQKTWLEEIKKMSDEEFILTQGEDHVKVRSIQAWMNPQKCDIALPFDR